MCMYVHMFVYVWACVCVNVSTCVHLVYGLWLPWLLQVNEMDVRVFHTFNPSSQTIEDYNYPFPGSKNATSSLKLLKFSFDNEKVRGDLV